MTKQLRVAFSVAILSAAGLGLPATAASAAPFAISSAGSASDFNPYGDSTWNPSGTPPGQQVPVIDFYDQGQIDHYTGGDLVFFDSPQVGPHALVNLTPLMQQGNNDLLFQVSGLRRASQGLGYTDGYAGPSVQDVSQVPEPTSMMLLGSGLLGLAATARKRRAQRAQRA